MQGFPHNRKGHGHVEGRQGKARGGYFQDVSQRERQADAAARHSPGVRGSGEREAAEKDTGAADAGKADEERLYRERAQPGGGKQDIRSVREGLRRAQEIHGKEEGGRQGMKEVRALLRNSFLLITS